ncbi:uncharacterized protein LOC129959884 [Argiope bruennichi]|uniref:uncharacterized protein LOC129959884 n=1 Tax=Argiope bruennichi TaxID=94029 RepID=UPI00249494E5|nr:uncharacterized protein LOC129959884 [Argiope bruennichi]
MANKGLKKLNILRKLCGTNWGLRSSTLKNTYCTVIRPVLEYWSPIWAQVSKSVKDTLDSVQHRASKIIIGKSRLQRSSTLQFDRDIRKAIHLDHSSLDITQEPLFPSKPPLNTKINTNLLEPCSKKEPTQVLLQKGEDTVRSLSSENSIIVNTDGSSDVDCNRGGAGISIIYPSGYNVKLRIPTGQIASNFTSELIAIKEVLTHFRSHSLNDSIKEIVIFSDSKSALESIHNDKTTITQEINTLLHLLNIPCTLQWIPAHVEIEGNECADALAKEACNEDQPRVVTCTDANTAARRRIYNQHLSKATIPDLNCPRNLSSTIARRRTGHFKGMKISRTNISHLQVLSPFATNSTSCF